MSATVLVEEGVSPHWPVLATDAPMLATPGLVAGNGRPVGSRPLTFVVVDGNRPVLAAYASVQTAHRPGEFFDPHHVLIAPTADFPLTDAPGRPAPSRPRPRPRRTSGCPAWS